MLSLDDKLLLITSRVFSLLEPNDQDDLVITPVTAINLYVGTEHYMMILNVMGQNIT